MSNILTNVTDIVYLKLNKEYKDLKEQLELVEEDILDLEISLCEKDKERYLLNKKIKKIEEQIIISVVGSREKSY